MCIIDKYYHKVKFILLEYKNIQDLDNSYITQYLNTCGNELNNTLVENYNNKLLHNEEIQINKKKHNNPIKTLYKNLARKLHPDKNNNKSDEFIEINKAYENDDFLTLFIHSYENQYYSNVNTDIDTELILLLDNEIKKIEDEINTIKNKIHWKWINANNDLEKELIHNYIKTQI